ncbi:MAG: GAF domain-containing protein, partial [Acidobacteriota bacterium]
MTSPLRALACVFLIAFAAGLSAQPAGRSSSPAAAAEARPREEGRPFIRHIPPSDYGGGGQNWAIVQDQRGLLYVGSSGGVLEYDGVSWRLLETPARQTVRSLAIDAANRIYVGSVGDFGYLAPDEHDELQFVSLKDRVPNDVGSFPDIWRTFVTAEGIIFQSEAVIFRWANDAIQVLKPLSRFNRASLVDGRVYLTLPESGLNVLDGNTFRPLPGTERLGNENYPVLLRYDDTRLLIGTRDNGLFL